jgi:predicted transcriptional regulator
MFSELLSPIEKALLSIINTRPQYCLENLATLGKSLNRSRRTVQYTIDKLVSKGLVIKQYTTFKRLKLVLVTMEQQTKLIKGGLFAQVFKYCAFKKQRKINALPPDVQSVAQLNVQSVARSIRRSNEKKSISEIDLKTIPKGFKSSLEIAKEKARQLEALKIYLNK